MKMCKVIAFTRTLFLVFALFFFAMALCSLDSIPFTFPAICFGIGIIYFGIFYALDQLLWQTAWSGDEQSPFTH